MCRELVSYADFNEGVTVSNNFTKQPQNSFKFVTGVNNS